MRTCAVITRSCCLAVVSGNIGHVGQTDKFDGFPQKPQHYHIDRRWKGTRYRIGTFCQSIWTTAVLCWTTLNMVCDLTRQSTCRTPSWYVGCQGDDLHYRGREEGWTIIYRDGVASAVAAGGVGCQGGAFRWGRRGRLPIVVPAMTT